MKTKRALAKLTAAVNNNAMRLDAIFREVQQTRLYVQSHLQTPEEKAAHKANVRAMYARHGSIV
jgi:hypothetical protein